jgi:predicted nuclease of predicted toxin-antitoxin system
MKTKLILLKRNYPTEYEVHVNEISQTNNLILTTKDKDYAERLVNRFNNKKEKLWILPSKLPLSNH